MTAHRPFFRLSAHETDPVNWFTGSLVPLVFGVLALGYGVVFTALNWDAGGSPLFQLLAVALAFSGCLVVHAISRPLRPPIGWAGAALALSMSSAAFLLSALGYAEAQIGIELWWAPFGLALTLGSLAPYLPARALLMLGSAATLITVPIAAFAVSGSWGDWGPVGAMFIVASPLTSGIAASTTFSVSVVARMLPLLEQRAKAKLALDASRGARVEAMERRRLASLTAPAVPFIERVLEAGRVEDADRARARELARGIRDQLVSASRLTWLDSIGDDRVSVSDPAQSAERMRADQRVALGGMISAITDQLDADAGTVRVELRGAEGGATAVSVSIDAELPGDGLQLRLAPYFLALRGTVDEFRMDEGARLRIAFTIPAQSGMPGAVAQHDAPAR
ncbi:hypothetical protein [Ruicaihuangia caeni]|uniref:Uncharacterized protein n=1 Tax=Ruicaihuangia caeni TaxID=3042517 RepID=A0AAW6T755_9MICO|nr:hypothetical protein [Klugiella sp. YN-L-19]MDI2097638.1 hypothetical protein [Klugiella sp. YN-L-19]